MTTQPIRVSIVASLLLAVLVGFVYAHLQSRVEQPVPRGTIERNASTSTPELHVALATTSEGTDAKKVTLGGRASRSYSIILPPQWMWQRSTVSRSSTYGNYGTPAFDERFVSTARPADRIALVVQSNQRTEVTPFLPSDSGHCSSEQRLEFSGQQIAATVRSETLKALQSSMGIPACGSIDEASILSAHYAEVRFCMDAVGVASRAVIVRGPGELYNECQLHPNPLDADYLRFNISCVGAMWGGVEGRAQCMNVLQSVVSSLAQQST